MLEAGLGLLQKDIKAAEDSLRKAIRVAPKFAPAYVRLGIVYNLNGKRKKAIEALRKALEIDPRQGDALGLLVQTYASMKQYTRAVKFCESMRAKLSSSPPHLALIDYLEGKLALSRKRTRKAEELFKKAINTYPNMLGPYVSLAGIYVRERRVDEAIAQYQRALDKNPRFLGGYMAMGILYDRQGDWKKAELYYRKALEIKPDFAAAANNLAWLLVEHGGNIDEALTLARTSKEKIPESAAVMDTLGWIYYLKGSYLNAISELHDALEKAPNNPVINYHMGMALVKNNEPEKGKEYLEKALKLDPNFEGAKEARRTLEALK